MNPRKLLARTSLALSLLAGAGAALAQTPAALPQLDVATSNGIQLLQSVAVDGQGNGNVTLLWTELFFNGGSGDRARGRRFSASDIPLGPDIVFDTDPSTAREVVANKRGDFIAIWNRSATEGLLRRVSPVLRPRTLFFSHPVDDVAIDQFGNFVIVWTASTPDGKRVFGQRYNGDGTTRGPEFNAATTLTGGQAVAGVAMNQQTGEFVVVWISFNADLSVRGIFGQRFGFSTGRQGSEFQVNTSEIGEASRLAADVGRAEDGSFVVVWSRRRSGEFMTDVFGQRFGFAGNKLGEEIVIADDAPISDGFVRLAVAPQGHFVTAWDDGAPPLFVRLYHKNGTPAGPARELVDGTTPFPGAPELAFGWNNTFVLGWTDFIGIHDPDDDIWEVNYQRFSASPGGEPCIFRNGHFRCDTNDSGTPEIDHVFAVRGGIPLLGDVDGDGRDDYCLFRGTRFDCDSGHDYGAAELTAIFGQPGDMPLLADVDDDGRDDVCVFRNGHFLCDTGRNGGAAESNIADIAFGQAGDKALAGDLNGDGHDDFCVVRGNEILCDTARDGGAAEAIIAFSAPGIPLMGDVNGDGRDDVCFAAGGTFRCDTFHDGGEAEVTVNLSGPAGRPLLGNVDGM
ncbi:MAG TPA: VCBS repeat-containing protein [Thermoanaerobaculia bacterium]|jgi:hypothetical protein|nr:VCBS repeat-containing protein [Thermoanaerobaculia bacterium]